MEFGKLLILCLCICGLLAQASATENEIKYHRDDHCKLGLNFTSGIAEMQFVNEAKNDDKFNDEFYQFKLLSSVTDDWELDRYYESSYVHAEVISNGQSRTVVIKPSEAFKRFEYEQHSEKSPMELKYTLLFHCGKGFGDTTAFTFVQPITDVNTHGPRFNRKEYKYQFGMPIKAGAHLSSLMEIYAVDVDFTNTKVEFTVEDKPDELEISYDKSDESKKMHNARLVTKKDFVKGTYSYTIRATDDGTPPKFGTAVVKIDID